MLRIIFLGFLFLQVFVARTQNENSLRRGVDFVWHSEYDSASLVLTNIIESKNQYSQIEVGIAYMYLGRTNQLQTNFNEAIVLYHKALELFKNEKEINLIAECQIWLSEYHRAVGQLEDGKKYLDKVAGIINKHQVQGFTKGLYYSRLAAYAQLEHDPRRINVLKYSKIANDIAIKINNQDLEATTINEMGFAFENMGDERSIASYLRAYDLWIESGNLHYAAESLVNVVREYIKRKNYKKAVVYAEKGFIVAKEKEFGELIQYFASQIMQIEERLGNFKKSLKYAHIYHNQYEHEIHKRWSRSILEVEKKYDIHQEQELTSIQKNKAVVANLQAKRIKSQRNYSIVISVMLVLFLLTVLYFSNNLRHKNKELKISLNQQQVLLKEVYHRVKNNLTFLSSLLFLRAKSIEDESTRLLILECESRVHSMAIVHQQLYQLSENTIIDFNIFCTTLFSQIDVFGSQENKKIQFHVSGTIRELNLNNSIFVGLIINELAINSVKHAQSLSQLEIGIELSHSDAGFDIKFFDNGTGLSEELSSFNEGGFGFKMIRLLTKQLNATISYYYQNKLNYFHLQIPNN